MQNRSAALVLAVLPFLAVPVSAQDRPGPLPATPKVEVFVGFEQQASLGDTGQHPSTPLWNGHIRFGVDWNVNDRVALVLSAPSLLVGSGMNSGTWVNYAFLAGPRLRFRRQQRVMPFVQALFGVEHGNAIPGSSTLSAVPFGSRERRTAFQSAVGAGIDISFGRRFAWRVLQIEERFGALDGDHRVSLSSGIVIRFGARK